MIQLIKQSTWRQIAENNAFTKMAFEPFVAQTYVCINRKISLGFGLIDSLFRDWLLEPVKGICLSESNHVEACKSDIPNCRFISPLLAPFAFAIGGFFCAVFFKTHAHSINPVS